MEYINSEGKSAKAIVEIKEEAELEQNEKKYDDRFKVAARWCENNDYAFHVITEKHLRGTCLDNIKALYPFRFESTISLIDTSILFDEIKKVCPISIGEVLAKYSTSKTDKAKIQTQLWILIARQYLHIDLSNKWDTNTLLYLAPVWKQSGLFFTSIYDED